MSVVGSSPRAQSVSVVVPEAVGTCSQDCGDVRPKQMASESASHIPTNCWLRATTSRDRVRPIVRIGSQDVLQFLLEYTLLLQVALDSPGVFGEIVGCIVALVSPGAVERDQERGIASLWQDASGGY
jgi:hypothetical protein